MTEERMIYMEKKNIVHTPEEILAAFEDNTAVVFELSRERAPSAKSILFGGIWQINPEAIITEADLCVMSVESTAHRKQILVIDKGGDKDTGNRILDMMYKSGVVTCCYVTFKEKKHGIKRCILQKFDNKIIVVKKMNLLVDGNDLLVTVRHLSQADREAKKNMGE
jgi:hypothetical protein